MTTRTRAVAGHPRSWTHALACACCIALSPLAAANAQLIPIKTVPLAEGDQFGFLPSVNLGMGSVSIAVADTLLDPFMNPAKATRLRRGRFFGSPSFYSVSRNTGSGRTLPIGAIARSGSSFVGFAVAVQEISPAGSNDQGNVVDGSITLDSRAPTTVSAGTTGTSSAQPHSNKYVSAIVGRMIPELGLSFGASMMWSGLGAVDGVDLLYTGSQSLRQSGGALDFRVGLLKEWGEEGDRSFEAVIVHNRFGLTHDVSFMDFVWDPDRRQPVPRPRDEHNLDRTNTSGVHLEYERPMADSGWRIGGLLTANRTSHPKLPGYAFANIPRDAGHSSAFNFGVGVSKSDGPSTVGLDVIYEPIWTRTGAESTQNRFRFSNSIVRAGLSRDFELLPPADPSWGPESSLRLQVGVQLRSIHYSLDEHDSLRDFRRTQDKSWKEWSRTVGATIRLPEVEVHYRVRSTSGAGRPVIDAFNTWAVADAGRLSVGPLPFPGPIAASTLQPVSATTHQFSVSVPIR